MSGNGALQRVMCNSCYQTFQKRFPIHITKSKCHTEREKEDHTNPQAYLENQIGTTIYNKCLLHDFTNHDWFLQHHLLLVRTKSKEQYAGEQKNSTPVNTGGFRISTGDPRRNRWCVHRRYCSRFRAEVIRCCGRNGCTLLFFETFWGFWRNPTESYAHENHRIPMLTKIRNKRKDKTNKTSKTSWKREETERFFTKLLLFLTIFLFRDGAEEGCC